MVHSRYSGTQWGFLAAAAIVLLAFWTTRLTESPIQWDAATNLRMSLNLERHGVLSLSTHAPYVPSMYREPLPPLLGTLTIKATDAALGQASEDDYFRGERGKLLKLKNLPWLALLSVVIFLFAEELGLSFLPSLVCVLLTNLLLLDSDTGFFMLDSWYTESEATALLSLGSLLLLQGLRRAGLRRVALAGVCFGLLTLVKASFLYITLGLAIAIPLLALLMHRPVRMAAMQAALLAVLTVLVVLPWMARNYTSIGYFGLSERGGEVLFDRAVIDQMSRDEYVGAYYFFAPYPLNGALRRLLGYSNQDVMKGGRLQRLNMGRGSDFYDQDIAAETAGRPENAVTYEHRAGAFRHQRIAQLRAAGVAFPEQTVDGELQARAVAIIRQHPFEHLALIPMYLWEGAFFSFPALVFILFHALRRRKYELAATVLPLLASLLFYAACAHLEPRYGIPNYPLVVCILVALVWQYAQSFSTNRATAVGKDELRAQPQ